MVILLIFLLVVIFIGGVYFLLKVSDVVRDFNEGHDTLMRRVTNLEDQVAELDKVVSRSQGDGSAGE